jgi:hypothetical protein
VSWTPSAFAKRRMVERRTSVRPCSRAGRRGCGMLTSFARSACERPAASRASRSFIPNRTASGSRVSFRRAAARFFGAAFFFRGVVTGSLSYRIAYVCTDGPLSCRSREAAQLQGGPTNRRRSRRRQPMRWTGAYFGSRDAQSRPRARGSTSRVFTRSPQKAPSKSGTSGSSDRCGGAVRAGVWCDLAALRPDRRDGIGGTSGTGGLRAIDTSIPRSR